MKRELDIQGPYDIGRRGEPYEPGEVITEQSHKDSVDVNTIVRRFKQTGDTKLLARTQAEYGVMADFDLHAAMNQIKLAQEIFGELPSEIRNRFDNDPQSWFDFASDPKNRDEMWKMGLLKEDVTPPPVDQGPSEKAEAPQEPSKSPPKGGE